MFASYDREQHRFQDVELAWEEQEFLERIAELVAGDCSLHEAVDWTVVEEAERYTGAQWADIRGVTADAVRSNVNSAREKLLAEEDRESSGGAL
jgi:DNA-directed RNA polymerase specialized sigma24 family protein